MHHQITSTESLSAPIGGGELARLIDGLAPVAVKDPARHKAPRPGLRGPGSKPTRRSTAEFEAGHDAVAARRRKLKQRRAELKEDREAEMTEAAKAEGMTLRQWRDAHVDAAKDVIFDHKHAGGREPTKAERKLVKNADFAIFMAEKLEGECTRDSSGYFVWPGGLVAGKYRRAAFRKRGLKSVRHPHYKRVAASVGRASKRNLIAGDAKDGMGRMSKKLYALDKPYVFFSAVCVDMWRIDIDRKFKSYEDLRAWIAHVVEEHGLPAMPHIASWIPDDGHPGEVHNPHLYILLPEGNAVWPHSPQRQHNMLRAVIKALQEAFCGDRGGNVHPYSGKNPLSWLVESRIVEPERMPSLGEWFEALDCEWTPDGVPDGITIDNLRDAAQAVDKESAAWFAIVRGVAFTTAQAFYRSGKIDLDDREGFKRAIKRAISGPLTKALAPSAGKQAKSLSEMIDGAATYAAESFDPSKLDRQHRNRGAAAHLIEKGMTKREREQTGQGYAAGVRASKSLEAIAEAIRLDLLCGRLPTVAGIADKGVRAYNTVAKHWNAAYAIAKSRIPAQRASVSAKGLFRGNLRFTAVYPLPGRAFAPPSAPSIIPDSALLGSGDPANPDTPLHFDPDDLLGREPTAAELDDYVGSTIDKLAAVAWQRSSSAETSRGARHRQARPNTFARPGAAFASFASSGIRSIHPAKRAA